MASVLEQLGSMTILVADTGEVAAVRRLKPVDCTTNPSLVLAALKDPAAEALVAREIEAGKAKGLSAEQICDTLTVAVGAELSTLVPGRVSTEVDAVLSFDTEASVARARAIIASSLLNKETTMKEWLKPEITESDAGMEVTSYLPAELDRA